MSFSPKIETERDYFGVDWTDELDDGETLSAASVTMAVKRGSGRDSSPSSMVSGSAAISGAVVSQLLIGGVAGVDYEFRCRVTTSAGRTLEERVPLLVR